MPDFDPNEYLKKQSQSNDFDPNMYLEENPIEKKNPIGNGLGIGTATSKTGFAPFQSPVDTKTPTVLTPKGKAEYQEQVASFKPPVPPKEGEPKKPKPDGGAGTAFMAGLNTFNKGLFKTPRLLYDAASSVTDAAMQALNLQQDASNYDDIVAASGYTSPLSVLDRLGDYYEGKAGQYAKRQEKFDKGIIDSFTAGEFKAGGKQLLNNISESVPSMVGMALTGGAGNIAKLGYAQKTIANALPFISQKNAELDQDESIPKPIRVVNATLNGLSEVIFDQSFGTQAMVQNVVDVFQKQGRDAAVRAAKDFTKGFAEDAIKKIQPVTGAVKGAIEEMATQLSQNIVDRYTVDPEKDLTEGVLDAGLTGGVMTGGIGAIGSVAYSSSQKKKVSDLMKQREELVGDLDNENLPEEVKSDLSDKLSKVDNQISKIDDDNETVVAKLSAEDKTILQEKEAKINAIEESLQDGTLSETAKNTLADTLLKEQEAVDTILTKEPVVAEALTKAETDLETLKQVSDKVRKYDASLKRLTDAKNAGTITENEFNDMKSRFDDVMGAAAPTVPTQESAVELLKDDKSGEPITVYHGTSEDFDTFSEEQLGNFTGAESAGKGFFFTDSENVANTYRRAGVIGKPNVEGIKKGLEQLPLDQQEALYRQAMSDYDAFDREDPSQSVKELLDKINEDTERGIADKNYAVEKVSKILADNGVDVEPYLTKGKTHKVKLKSKNPKIVDAGGMDSVEFDINKAIDAAKAEGHDAIIIKNLSDEYVLNEKGANLDPSNIYVVFDKNQIVTELNPQENAIQEQTTNEIPLQPEAAVSAEVAEGVPGAGLEVVTDQSETIPQGEGGITQAFDLIEQAKRTKKTEKGKMEAGELAIAELGDVGKKAIFIDNNFKDIVSKIKGLKDQKGEPFVKIDCS